MFDPEPKPVKRFSAMTDDELFHLGKSFSQFYNALGKVASRCKMRARAVQSVIDQRSAKRLAGKKVTITDGGLSPKDRRRAAAEITITGNEVTVSDHALVRYLERVKGMDFASLRAEIADRIRAGESHFGGSVVTDAEGYTYIRRPDGFVKTVMHQDWLSEDDLKFNAEKFDEFVARHGED